MSWPPTPSGAIHPAEPPPVTPRGRGWTGVGLVLVGLSLIVGVTSGIKGTMLVAKPLSKTLTSPARATPVDEALHLDQGTYVVFELQPGVTPADVTIVGPDGNRIGASDLGNSSETMTRQNSTYTGAVEFDVPAPGDYQVTVTPDQPDTVVIAPSLGSGFIRAWRWLAALGAGIGGLTLGVIFLIVGGVKRRRSRRPVARPFEPAAGGPEALPPAGWYTDPTAAGRMRYWDGRAWQADVQ
jgi:hypothetical protein